MPDKADFETEADAFAFDETGGYRPISMLSVAGLLLGIASGAAFLYPLMLAVAAVGVVVSVLALRRIARFWPELAGWRTAVAGLLLSLMLGSGATGYELFGRWRVRTEGQRFAAQWFEFLRKDQPEKAHHLTLPPRIRQPLDDRLRTTYVTNPYRRQELEKFVSDSVVRTLLALGERAIIRLYSTEGQRTNGDREHVAFAYAVTFKQEGRMRTFFVVVGLERADNEKTGKPDWSLVDFHGGYRPKSWTDEEEHANADLGG